MASPRMCPTWASRLSFVSAVPADLAQALRDDAAWIRSTMARLPWRATTAIALSLSLAALVAPSSAGDAGTRDARHVAFTRDGSAGLPFSGERGRMGAESSARAMAATVGLPLATEDWRGYLGHVGAGTPRECPPSRLRVSWVAPAGAFEIGAHVEPLGPVPTTATERVNGVVLCRGSDFAYLGFEAVYETGRWWLTPVPALAEEDTATLLPGEEHRTGAMPAVAPDVPGDVAALPPVQLWGDTAIEPLAPHGPQLTCDPIAKSGVLGFRDLLLAAYPGTRNLGIGRACDAPGVSEHKEGRAFDWGVRVDIPEERAAAQAVLAWLLAADGAGRPYAIARRLGLMYVIWDGQIWSAEKAIEGWRTYVGVSDHVDHIHFSFAWPGALAQTSFWTGDLRAHLAGNAPDLPLAPRGLPGFVPMPPAVLPGQQPSLQGSPGSPGASGSGGGSDPHDSPRPSATTTQQPSTTTTSTSTTSTTTTTTAPPPPATTPVTLPPVGGVSSLGD